jgi:hypothetical protein
MQSALMPTHQLVYFPLILESKQALETYLTCPILCCGSSTLESARSTGSAPSPQRLFAEWARCSYDTAVYHHHHGGAEFQV